MNRRTKPGFTLVELLVVIAIIGVLVALLLPAVQAAREAARRSSCSNNLSQLIIAVHNYEMAMRMYPPGTIDASGPVLNAPLGYQHNWLVQILPYIEQRNAWELLDKSVSVYHPKNAAVVAHKVRILNCPSSSADNANMSYAGVHHDIEAPIDADNQGVFFLNSKLRYDDVSDGSSHTAFLGEKLPDGWDISWLSGTRATLRNMGFTINAQTYSKGLARPGLGGGFPMSTMPLPGEEGADEAAPGEMSLEEEVLVVVDVPAAQRPAAGPGNPQFVGGFASSHPGGAQFAFGDGSLRYVSASTALAILQQFGHRADGKLPPSEY